MINIVPGHPIAECEECKLKPPMDCLLCAPRIKAHTLIIQEHADAEAAVVLAEAQEKQEVLDSLNNLAPVVAKDSNEEVLLKGLLWVMRNVS